MTALIEREEALRKIHSALAATVDGGGRTVLVTGEAGIGKTSLVAHLCAHQSVARVLMGGCDALFSPRPLGPLYDMAAELGPRLRAMLDARDHGAPLFAALLAHLEEARTPVILVLEDLHWADAATLDLVKFLGRRIHRTHCLLVLTYRDDALGERHPLRGVFGDLAPAGVTRIALAPLTEAGIAELARKANKSADGVYAATAGNPFFVTEVIQGEALPATVREAVLARTLHLPPAVRDLLDLVAIMPGRAEAAIIEALLAPTADTVSAALSCGLLAAQADAYQYRHELGRIAIEHALPAPLAGALHAKVLRYLTACAARVPTSRLVHHAAGAGDLGAVREYAPLAAAEAAASGAHLEAAALYGVALAHTEHHYRAEHADLLESRAYHCYMSGMFGDAIDGELAALAIRHALGDRLSEGRALRRLSRYHWLAGHGGPAVQYADQALRLMQDMPPNSELAWVLSTRSQLYMLNAEMALAVSWGERAMTMARQLGDAQIAAHIQINLGAAYFSLDNPVGWGMLEDSLRQSLQDGHEENVMRASMCMMWSAMSARQYALALRVNDATAQYMEARDMAPWEQYLYGNLARMDFERGDWAQAQSTAEALLRAQPMTIITELLASTVLGRLRGLRGEAGAPALLHTATLLARATGELQRLGPVAAARAEAAWLRDDDSPSDPLVSEIHALARQRGDRRFYSELSAWCQRLGWRVEIDHSLLEPACARQLAGDWRAAATQWGALGCRYERALALLDGDDAALHAALAEFETLGATLPAKRCRKLLRQRGIVTRTARAPRATTKANFAGLTEREFAILLKLKDGLSNAELAAHFKRSERTIENHVSAVLAKLNVRSRGEAAVIMSRLDASGQG